jgi:glycosyltransferase involved in cell wall biosynthesis
VRTLGALTGTEVLGWLARAAVFAAPARYEPFGLTALEAALSGCALVLGEIPSLREVWGEAALFVCPEDAAGLAAVTNRLLHDPVERSRMAGAARERAARYTVEAMSAGYLSAYRQLAATPAGVAL